MSIKKVFHFWPSQIVASMHGQYGPSRLDWPHMLAAISEGQKWETFLVLFCPYMGIEVQKSALPTLFHFARVWAASQPHVRRMDFEETLWQISLQKQFFMVEMQFFCKEISQKVGLIINWYSFAYERNNFVSNIQFFCIFMNCICNLMALQIIAKLVQKLCMIFEIFCHTNWTQNLYKSFANIFKIFSSFHMIILNHCKRFAILFKNLGFLDKMSQNQCKIFVL